MVIWQKLAANDPTVLYVDIPGTPYAVRIFDMARFAQFCIDFFDSDHGVTVNKPEGCEIYPLYSPFTLGSAAPGAPLVSWEQAMRVALIPAGSEKFSVPEGSYWKIVRRGGDNVCFSVPFRDTSHQIVQPAPRLQARGLVHAVANIFYAVYEQICDALVPSFYIRMS